MNKLLIAAALVGAAAATPAAATYTLTSTLGGDGFVLVNGPAFTIYGTDNGADNSVTSFSTVASVAGTIAGKFRYRTNDVDGSSFDPAGYFINSDFFQLSISGVARPAFQPGTFSFNVNAGDTYGFYVATTDGALGRGVLAVFAVPEPESWALLIAGFGLVGAAARRRRKAVAA